MKRNYLMLIAASRDNLGAVRKLLAASQTRVDPNGHTLWVDSKGLGVTLTTDKSASEVWSTLFEFAALEDAEQLSIKDLMIIELGQDWATRPDSPLTHWFTRHLGRPLPKSRR